MTQPDNRPDVGDAVILADAIVQAWEKSPHQFTATYQHQLQLALIAARCLVDIADEPAHRPTQARVERLTQEWLTKRVAEVVEEDGGCWSACSGCQESVDGCVSAKDYPYSPIFKCQPGSGCRECGGIGVVWMDGAFLSIYGDALSEEPAQPAMDAGALRKALEQVKADIVNMQGGAGSEFDIGLDCGLQNAILAVDRRLAALAKATEADGGAA